MVLSSDTILLDSLPLIRESLKIRLSDGGEADTADYKIENGRIIFRPGSIERGTKLEISYATFPFELSKPLAHKDPALLSDSNREAQTPVLYYPSKMQNNRDDLFGLSDFNKSGSISRAISVGNSQDLSVASNLNLQIAGDISPGLQLKASVSDNNIPIQPDGNTQQLQDFDNVYIQLSHKNGMLIAGDYRIDRPRSYFLNYHKKAQGAYADVHFPLTKKKDAPSLRTYGGIAISRGKFARNKISGIEGSQGPYKLHGANFERYIVVLSGTERVYIDGKLMKRGANYDYVIDYNTAEITFMPRVMITKDKRIYVEFQYSDRAYASYLINAGLEYRSKKLELATHFYKESDLKDQTLDQDLSEAQKQLLYNIGDSLFLAVSPKVDSVPFSGNEVLYKKIDSLGYSPVYVYSVNPDSAHYRLGFTMVGAGNGDYVQVKSAANGRVFKWVAPVNGVRQGDYEPVVLLVTPKNRQMLSMSGKYEILKNTHISAELAMSNKDLNLFSPFDDTDNKGVATKVGIDNLVNLSKTKKDPWQLKSRLDYQYVDKNFSAIERFRPVEFDRDWNIKTYDYKEQHLFGASLRLQQKNQGFAEYRFSNFIMQADYKGMRNRLLGNLNPGHRWHLDFDGSLTSSEDKALSSRFLRHHLNLSKAFGKLRLGAMENAEDNRFRNIISDSLTGQSIGFQELGAYIESGDSLKNQFRIHYKWREDRLPLANNLRRAMLANEAGMSMALLKNRKNKLRMSVNYRKLEIADSNLTKVRPDQTGLGRVDHNLRLWKGGLIANSFYQIGSVMEVEKEYSYIEVARGQGVYSWTDYNGNGVKELDEFDIAAFPDQANYIRVYIPGTDYIKTFGNQFSTSVMLNLSRLWRRSPNKFLKVMSHFSDQLVFRSQHKTQDNDAWSIANPFFFDIYNSKVLNLNNSFRNTFYFNRTHPKYGANISYRNHMSKILMTNGFEVRDMSEWQLRLRWNFAHRWQFNIRFDDGVKESNSEYFTSRDYRIDYNNVEPNLVFQPSKFMRISLSWMYSLKENRMQAFEKMQSNSLMLNAKYNLLKKGILSGMVQYISMEYSGEQNSPVAFEMMQGLRSGDNFTWNISYQRTILRNLQLSLMYNGRKAADTETVHIGSVQLRAFF